MLINQSVLPQINEGVGIIPIFELSKLRFREAQVTHCVVLSVLCARCCDVSRLASPRPWRTLNSCPGPIMGSSLRALPLLQIRRVSRTRAGALLPGKSGEWGLCAHAAEDSDRRPGALHSLTSQVLRGAARAVGVERARRRVAGQPAGRPLQSPLGLVRWLTWLPAPPGWGWGEAGQKWFVPLRPSFSYLPGSVWHSELPPSGGGVHECTRKRSSARGEVIASSGKCL